MKLSNNQKAIIYTMLFWLLLGVIAFINVAAPMIAIILIGGFIVGWISYLVYLMCGGQ